MDEWSYFADGNQVLIRVPETPDIELTDRSGQRYHRNGHWSARDVYSGNWATELTVPDRYRRVAADEAAIVASHIDTMPGGVFRDRGRFWPDQAHRWTIERATRRAEQLEAEAGPDSDHWTIQEYNNDVADLERLQAFIAAG